MDPRCFLQWIYGCFLILITEVAYIYGGCPGNIPEAVSHCLTGYEAQIQAIGKPENIFSGIDVENIRLICTNYMSSMLCIRMMSESCPAAQREKINHKIKHVLYLKDLCTRQNLYESYAMHQYCFGGLRSKSSECYRNFELDTNPITSLAMTGNRPAIKECCRQFDKLLQCVNQNVHVKCGPEASSLVEDLVRPSVKIGVICKIESMTTTQPPSTVPPKPPDTPYKPRREDKYRTINSAATHTASNIGLLSLGILLCVRTLL